MPSVSVTSHVARDLLQSAQLFKSDKSVVWEYVANGLQYSNPGVPPKVIVNIDEKKKLIRIGDNGRGMSVADLEHFFTMHGENPERATGRIGRGMFGTGKSAAFAIGSTLRITTVHDGKRTIAELRREDVDAVGRAKEIPVNILDAEISTGQSNGTVVEIERIHLKRLDRAGIIQYIERHLAHYPKDIEVIVDHHVCEYKQPEVAAQTEFFPSGEDAKLLGNARLAIRVARAPLEEDSRGISIFSHGNWHATTLAGADGRPMAEYLFGDVDVPNLEDYETPIPAYDSSRSGVLNSNNDVVAALYRFVGPAIDKVRRELVSRERERSRTEEAKKLAQQASRIAEILSVDFAAFQVKLARVESATSGRDIGRSRAPNAGDDGDRWVEGGDQIAERAPHGPRQPKHPDGDDPKPPSPDRDVPEFSPAVAQKEDGDTTGERRGEGKNRQHSPKGGFRVEYQNIGADERRGQYISDRRTIVINLDHPQVAAAEATGGVGDPVLLRLTFEIALSEYAVALAQELVDQYDVPDEALFDIRDTIDRVSRRFAPLYGR